MTLRKAMKKAKGCLDKMKPISQASQRTSRRQTRKMERLGSLQSMLLINHTLPVMLGLLSNSLSKATIH
jgi:hypothetical protein